MGIRANHIIDGSFEALSVKTNEMGGLRIKLGFSVDYTDKKGTVVLYNAQFNPFCITSGAVDYYDKFYDFYSHRPNRTHIDLELMSNEDGEYAKLNMPEEPPREMTMDEIENKLGYKVKIVND